MLKEAENMKKTQAKKEADAAAKNKAEEVKAEEDK